MSVPEMTRYLHTTLPGIPGGGGSLPYASCIWSKPGLIGAVPKAALGGGGSALHGIPSPRPKLWTPVRPLKERFASISPGHLFADVGVCRCLLAISGFVAPYARPDMGGLPSAQPWFDVGHEPFITGRVLMPVDAIQPKAMAAPLRPEDGSEDGGSVRNRFRRLLLLLLLLLSGGVALYFLDSNCDPQLLLRNFFCFFVCSLPGGLVLEIDREDRGISSPVSASRPPLHALPSLSEQAERAERS